MKHVGHTMRWGLGAAILCYALLIGVLQFVWHTGIGATWWLDVLNIFGLWLYLPLPLGIVAAVFARPRAFAWLFVVPLLAFGWEYHALVTLPAPTQTGTPLRVMTWNILWSPHLLDPVIATIEQQQPDIVALQELGVKQAAVLAPLLAERYPYSAIAAGGSAGLGVWSRYPIIHSTPREQQHDGCACQRMTVDIAGMQVRLINAHPESPRYHLRHWRPWKRLPYFPIPIAFSTAYQDAAHRAIAAEAERTTERLIVVGDFNVNDRQPNYRLLRRSLQDAYREAGTGFGLTFPNASVPLGRFTIPPLLRIDYIFHNDGIVATAAHTVANPVSDHRAVVADLLVVPKSDP